MGVTMMQLQTQHVHGIIYYVIWAFGPGTGFLTAIWWLANKLVVTPVKDAWQEAATRLKHIEEVANVATENHLTTIEANGKKTNEILEAMHLSQAEMSGYIKASLDKAPKG
jgi:hypothetical protein